MCVCLCIFLCMLLNQKKKNEFNILEHVSTYILGTNNWFIKALELG